MRGFYNALDKAERQAEEDFADGLISLEELNAIYKDIQAEARKYERDREEQNSWDDGYGW